ncbi:MAG TPA: tetratricopeptide repeat protein [Steroidobacteraceae bacterium]|nr:tetratricopeptide repeat protein [Steroidobacteraceae bacterium]
MQTYSVQDVERVLRLSRSSIRSLIDGGFVKPARGPRRELRFSFQDLIVLRAARALTLAKVSHRRIKSSLKDLRKSLPEEMPLSGLSIAAVGDRVVVREGKTRYQVDDGQYLLGLDVSLDSGELRVVERKEQEEKVPAAREEPADWFEEGLELEDTDPRAAQKAYEHAVSADPGNAAAWINWGRLVHEQGKIREAERIYRRALDQCGADSLLMFNLGVVLEDLGKTGAAFDAYQAAINEDPTLADCHFNLARLYESMGRQQHAIRHLIQYRRLLASDSR